MADFDPFANLRGRRKPEPHAVIMDPHDPFRPKVAPESPYVGGSSAGGWSKERDFSSYSSSISSSNEASSSTKFGAQPTSRPHDSGGVAISLTGPLPGNNTVNEHNSSRFADSAWWNQNINASALNVSMYPVINSTGNESMYNDAYNALNMSMYPDAYNESMYADAYNAYNESMYADAYNAYNESMYANAYNAYNESMYADAYNAYNESMYADAYNAFNDSMYADAYSASNMSMYPDNNTSVSLESSAYSRESINNSALYDSYVRDGKLSADFIPNETLNDTFASSNETFDSANSQIVSNHIAAIGDRTNVEHDIASGVDRTDNAFIANTAKVTNGLFVPETIGKLNMRFDNSIDTKVQNSNHDRNTIAGTFSSQASGTSQDPNQLEQGVGNEMLSPFYDNVNDKLSALNRMHHVSSNNIEVTRGDVSVHHNRSPNAIDLSPPPAIQVPASWANGVNNASEPVFTADGSANQLPGTVKVNVSVKCMIMLTRPCNE